MTSSDLSDRERDRARDRNLDDRARYLDDRHDRDRGASRAAGVGVLILLMLVAVGVILFANARTTNQNTAATDVSTGSAPAGNGTTADGVTGGINDGGGRTSDLANPAPAGGYPDYGSSAPASAPTRGALSTAQTTPTEMAPPLPGTSGAPFAISVGTYPTRPAADAEVQRLAALTSLPVAVSLNGHSGYRVTAGSFATQEEATTAATALARTANVAHWQVVAIGQR